MTAVLAVELRRLLARRLTRGLAALIVLAFTLAGVVVFLTESDPGFRLIDVRDALTGTSVQLVALAVVVAASFVGAEWHHGRIASTLTWEPRRRRLLGAKLAAVGGVTLVGSLLAQALLVGALIPAAVFRGTTEGADGAWLAGLVGLGLRIALLAALTAVVAFSLAMVLRSTAGALAVGAVYVIVVEPLLAALRPGVEPWQLATNGAQLVVGPGLDAPLGERSLAVAALVVAAYAAVALAAALALFVRRDVT